MKTAWLIGLSVLLGVSLAGCRHTETESTPQAVAASTAIALDPQSLSPNRIGWSARSDYVAVNIPFDPMPAVKSQLEALEKVKLKSRGEAHITLLSPQELNSLKTRLSLEQINGTVEKLAVQTLPVQLQCLGRGQLKQGSKKLSTYFIVVAAPELAQVREKLKQQFIAAGGDKQALAYDPYYPHITVGFTDRDLHLADGVVKDQKACVYQIAKPE